MLSHIKQLIKQFFTLNKSEQKGVFILLLIIVLLAIVNICIPDFFEKEKTDFTLYKTEINKFRERRRDYNDSIQLRKKQEKGELTALDAELLIKPFSFDPNTISLSDWLKIGLNHRQFNSVQNYLRKAGSFRTKNDFKKMYSISENEYNILEPFIEIKKSKSPVKASSTAKVKKKEYKLKKHTLTELNAADSLILVKNLHIKPWLASRIIKFRALLGGFYSKNQLLEVYGLKYANYLEIEKHIIVDTTLIEYISINDISFKQLLKHPYFDYETTSQIFNNKPYYLDSSRIASLNNFKDRTKLADSIYYKIHHYLYFGPPK